MPERDLERLVVELNDLVKSRYFGKYRGLVQDNNDPEKLGRVQVLVPEVLGAEVKAWALPCTPYAGDGSGQYTIPPKGAGVWVEFEAGDVSRPIWTGCWWGESGVPQTSDGKSGAPDLKVLRSEQGLMVTLEDDSQTITVSDTNGNNMLKIQVQQGQITLLSATKTIIEAPQIELVENAPHPLVFGDDLLQYLNQLVQMFNTHLHPGELAAGVIPDTPMIPVPPFPPATPALLSTRVKTG
jgi:hypothetical protein